MTTYIQDLLQEEYDSLTEALGECQQLLAAHERESEKLRRELERLQRQQQDLKDFTKTHLQIILS